MDKSTGEPGCASNRGDFEPSPTLKLVPPWNNDVGLLLNGAVNAAMGKDGMVSLSSGDDVTCRPQKAVLESSLFSRTTGKRAEEVLLEPEPCPERAFFQPNLADIFFQLLLLPSRAVCGDVPGEISLKGIDEVGGVFGGVIGSRAEPDGEGESALSSVRLSGFSPDEVPDDPDTYVERRDADLPKAAVR